MDFPFKIEKEDIISLVKKAGDEILEIYENQSGLRTYKKRDSSPVTEADFLSQKIILKGLKKYGWKILSEETEDDLSRLGEDKIWIVDPLDGTREFLDKKGEFSVMVGLVVRGEPVLGVVYKPCGGKIYFAEKGKGAYLKENGKDPVKLEVSSTSSLSEAHLLVTRSHFDGLEKKFVQNCRPKKVTPMGSIGVKLGQIAEGKADCYVTLSNKTSEWDICAPEIILKEAGGKVTDLKGENFVYNRKEVKNLNGIVASNGKIHNQLLSSGRKILGEF